MTDITLESYIIRDSYANEIERVATEGIGRTPLGLTAEEYVARSKALANEMTSNKNPANQKKTLEKFKDLVDDFSASVKSKNISAPEAKTVIIAILGVATTLLIAFGAVKLGAKIKNLLKQEDPEAIEAIVTDELNKSQVATEAMNPVLGTALNIMLDPKIYPIVLILMYVVLPLVIIWKTINYVIKGS